jgi:glycine/D-amino acid oxidase-like deaminating enzyme
LFVTALEFDYVIVGGGAAGLVVAARLSKLLRVLLVTGLRGLQAFFGFVGVGVLQRAGVGGRTRDIGDLRTAHMVSAGLAAFILVVA